MTMKRETIWTALLGLVAVLGSYAFACVFPFAAIAALAAVTLDARRGAVLVGATFIANQAVGFTLMGYPLDAQAFAWSAFIAVGAFAALGVARMVCGDALVSVRTIAALGTAIIAYQLVMFAGAVVLDGFASSTPAIVAQIALNDALWFAGLSAVYLVMTRGLERLMATEPAPA